MEVLFGTPNYRVAVCPEYDQSMSQTIAILDSEGIAWRKHTVTENPFVDRARNEIVHFFLNETSADHLLFVDDDVGWDAKAVTRILSYKQDIVGGLVPKRAKDADDVYHQNALTGVMQDGLMQAFEIPTAFLRISREAFYKIIDAYPEYKTMDSTCPHIPFFQTGIRNGGFQGEDIFFCRQWVAMGEHLWVDSDISFTHRGSKAWRGNFYDHAVKSGLLINNSQSET